ncbi:MAG: winged helix-turn-helix domain-containing protein, partial [Candidatus Eremiobacteraeota bacterium]|nr:winged helix-turn-helix domain-containing protein [Candidatus Eremiobacteraeota bacterium]
MAQQLTATSRRLAIFLLGSLRVAYDRTPFEIKLRTATLRLLAVLLLRRERPLTRDHVAFTLWPDETEETARTNLRRHLYNLRTALPAVEVPWVRLDSQTIQWNPEMPLDLDIAEFERLARAGDAGAIDLYRGDLLESLEDEWLFADRERLRALYIEALWSLAQRSAARRDAATAEHYLQQLLARDPWREDGLRVLMSLRYENGDRSGALRACSDFEERLRREIGASLMEETVALRNAITNEAPIQKLPVPNNLPVRTS